MSSNLNKETCVKLSDTSNGIQDGWSRQERRMWFLILFIGTCAIYSSRTTLPLVAPEVALVLSWNKAELGTVLSSFFWGYSLTQILGGYLSDMFGAERILLITSIGWGLITFWFHSILYLFKNYHDLSFLVTVFFRIIFGALQGVHFPSIASICSRNILSANQRSSFFGALMSGSAFGALFTGAVGSYIADSYGILCLIWSATLHFYTVSSKRIKDMPIGVSLTKDVSLHTMTLQVPWLKYLSSPSLWSCIICHFCYTNCYFILLSWLPTYFHDNFPEGKGWVFNVIPWAVMIPGIYIGNSFSIMLINKGFSVGATRKIVEGIGMITLSICLFCLGKITVYMQALILLCTGLFAGSFHNVAIMVNPSDMAPKHTGSVFGLMNSAGAIPGFVGVYIAGYILHLTNSWTYVFGIIAWINMFGILTFVLLGTGEPIL